MNHVQDTWEYRRTEYRFFYAEIAAEIAADITNGT